VYANTGDLAKALLIPLLERSAARDWTSPLPPHDLGTFPHALGSGSESSIHGASTAANGASLILLVAALCQREGRVEFAARYWKQISSWSRLLAEELSATGSAQPATSSRAKSILALGAVARLVQQMGSAQRSQELAELARARSKELGNSQLTASELRDVRAWSSALKLELFSSQSDVDTFETTSVSAARSDADAVFLRVLGDADVWSRWFARGARGPLNWASAPIGTGVTLAPDARSGAHEWSWTTNAPAEGWQTLEFDAASWAKGPGAFAAPAATLDSARTPWSEPRLWLRRSFELASVPQDEVRLSLQLLGEVEIWINGVLAARVASGAGGTLLWKLTDDARAALAPGRNILAVRCARAREDAVFDAGIVLLPRARR